MAGEAPLILVVDDDPDFVEMHEDILVGGGYRVVKAFDTDSALAALARERPQLVVSDLMMSALDAGFSLSRRVRVLAAHEGWPPVPVIIVSAVGSRLGFDFRPRTAADFDAMCTDAFFDKPVRAEQLLTKVRELLARRPE